MELNLAYGHTSQSVVLPDTVQVALLDPATESAPAPPEELITQALAEPIGSLPLGDCVRGAKRLVIVISDITRPCPSAIMLPPFSMLSMPPTFPMTTSPSFVP